MSGKNCTLKDRFLEHGERIRSGGNRPFVLDGTASVWLVETGPVEVFAAAMVDDPTAGPRTHVLTVAAGEILLGTDPLSAANGLGLIAVGGPETLLIRLPLSRFREVASDPALADPAMARINRWAEGLALGFTGIEKPPADVIVKPGARIDLNVGQAVRADHGVLWVQMESDTPPCLESIPLPPSVLDSPFPVTAAARLEATEALHLDPIASPPATGPGSCWAGLHSLRRTILAGIEHRRKEDEALESARLFERLERDQRKQQHAFEELASVVQQERAPLAGIAAERPLAAACRLVGRHQGIAIVEPAGFQPQQTVQAQVEAIARASRAGVRRVRLHDDWWRRDNGAILGFLQEDRRPVALIPDRPGSYVLLDPQARTRVPVDEAVAGRISSGAFLLYATYPDKKLSLRDILRPAVRGIRAEIIMVLLMGSAGALLALLVPVLTGLLFDYVIPEASHAKLGQIALILFTCALVSALFEFTKAISILRLKGKIDPIIEAAVLDRVISLPIPFFRKFSTGDLTNRSLGICAISKILSDVSIQTLLGVVFSSFNFLLLFYYDWHLALIAVGFTVVGVIAITVVSYYQMHYQRLLTDIDGKLSGALLQMINGISKLRVSGTEGRAFAVWAEQFSSKRRLEYRSRTLQNALDTFNGAFPILTAMAIFSWVVLKSSETFTTGNFIAFNAAYTNFQGALLQMGSAFTSLLAVAPFHERARPIFECLPEVRAESHHPGILKGEISTHQLVFRYDPDGPMILNGVSLRLRPGEFVALVGSSGSGKSTLLRLLLGFEHPEAGTVYYDRQDLANLNVQEVRRQIGVVLQNGGILAGSIFQNIVGTSGMGIDAAWDAAAQVGLKEDIEAMPRAMHTILDPGGFTLSGGQRQRLLIARAIVRRPRMLFFDEATSALDNRTQALVSRSLDRLQATRLVIAHRLSTIRNADHIVVMHQGSIVERGRFEDLMANNGFFTELAKRQIA